MNKLCKLCYRHQNFPESAKIADCYNDSMTVPVWTGELSCVFKGSYQRRPVAVKVFQLYTSNREAIVRVSTLVVFDLTPDFLTRNTEILQRGGDLETPSASQHPPIDWRYYWWGAVFDGF